MSTNSPQSISVDNYKLYSNIRHTALSTSSFCSHNQNRSVSYSHSTSHVSDFRLEKLFHVCGFAREAVQVLASAEVANVLLFDQSLKVHGSNACELVVDVAFRSCVAGSSLRMERDRACEPCGPLAQPSARRWIQVGRIC